MLDEKVGLESSTSGEENPVPLFDVNCVEAVCDEGKPFTYSEALAISKEQTRKVYEEAKEIRQYISMIDVFKDAAKDGDTILLGEKTPLENILEEIKECFAKRVPATCRFEKLTLAYTLKTMADED